MNEGQSMHQDAILRGAAIISAIKRGGVEFVVSVPDIVTSEHVLWPISRDPDLKLIRVCKEDEGVAIIAGLAACDRKALLLIQNTGFFYAINAIRAIAVEYRQPVCMMIGLQGKEPDVPPAQSAKYGVRIVEPILDVMGIEHHPLHDAGDVAQIAPAIAKAYAASRPVAFIVGRSPA
jgi:sulfopyruvate decarboxylase subunit beta